MIEVRFIGSKPVSDAAVRLYELLKRSYQAGKDQDDEATDKALAEAAYAFEAAVRRDLVPHQATFARSMMRRRRGLSVLRFRQAMCASPRNVEAGS
jgi:hypothetical protein